jgi:hypothetical protein
MVVGSVGHAHVRARTAARGQKELDDGNSLISTGYTSFSYFLIVLFCYASSKGQVVTNHCIRDQMHFKRR